MTVEDLVSNRSNSIPITATTTLTHIGITAIHAFDVDWNQGVLVIAGNVAYG